jgi:hypothetical protein
MNEETATSLYTMILATLTKHPGFVLGEIVKTCIET